MKFINKVHVIEELFVGYALLLVAIIASIQVFMRYVLNLSFDWVEEASRHLVVMITFIGAGICVRYGSHFAMDALVQYAPNRVKHVLNVVSNLVSCIVMFVVFYFSWVQIEKLHRFESITPAIEMPMYVPYLPIGIFSIVISFRFFLLFIDHIIAFVKNSPFENTKEKRSL
ncbi:TRAP transporter small permease [bacterium]|nr:TRAP transporter small permease [bacterium]